MNNNQQQQEESKTKQVVKQQGKKLARKQAMKLAKKGGKVALKLAAKSLFAIGKFVIGVAGGKRPLNSYHFVDYGSRSINIFGYSNVIFQCARGFAA